MQKVGESNKVEISKEWSLREFKLERREVLHLNLIKRNFEEGNLDNFLSEVKKAKNSIRRRERRVTYWLIRAAKRAKIAVYGNSIDIFEKDLLAKHKALYQTLNDMVSKGNPNDEKLPRLIPHAFELEKEIIKDVRALIATIYNRPEQN